MLNTNLRLLDLLIRLGLVRRVTAPTGLALYEGPHVYSGQLEYASRHRATGRRTRSAVVDADSLADVADGSVPPLLTSAQVCLLLHVTNRVHCVALSHPERWRERERERERNEAASEHSAQASCPPLSAFAHSRMVVQSGSTRAHDRAESGSLHSGAQPRHERTAKRTKQVKQAVPDSRELMRAAHRRARQSTAYSPPKRTLEHPGALAEEQGRRSATRRRRRGALQGVRERDTESGRWFTGVLQQPVEGG